MTKKPLGFSLIELMIVIALVGITTILAIPAYQNFLGRSKVSELMHMAGAYQAAITECYQTRGTFTECSSGANGIPEAESATFGTIAAVVGSVVFTTNEKATPLAPGSKIALTPRVKNSASAMPWDCTTTIPASYLPSSCSVSSGSTENNSSNLPSCASGILLYASNFDANGNGGFWCYQDGMRGYPSISSCPSGTTLVEMSGLSYCSVPQGMTGNWKSGLQS